MLCRIVLTAIAISYVICVLLLSGLQKEDLDVNTLVKLRRHNVNIYDMNNEHLRQECLAKSYLDSGKGTTGYEDPNDKTKISTYKQSDHAKQLTYRDALNIDTHKSEMVTPEIYSVDKSKQNLNDTINVKRGMQREEDRNDKGKSHNLIENKPEDINITMIKENKDQNIEYLQNQPSLDSVMKFWAKLSNRDVTIAETTTTNSPSPTEERRLTTASTKAKQVNVHSKNMEYISKMIAEYLRSQTVPTTTPTSPRSTKDMDTVSIKIKQLLDSSKMDPVITPKNVRNTFGENLKELGDITEFSKMFQTYNNNQEESAIRIPQQVVYDDNIDLVKGSENVAYGPIISVSPKPIDIESEKKMQALQYLRNMLKVNKKIRLNGPISVKEVDTTEATLNKEDQDKHEKQKIHHHYYTTTESNIIASGIAPNTNFVKEKVGTVSADVIKEIAEKVKEIVMRDIRKEIPTTERATSSLATAITTASTCTTVNPTIKETSESNVIQTLMELFKEFKTMKESTRGTTDMPMKYTSNYEKYTPHNILSDRIYPPLMGSFNPYVVKPPVVEVVKRLEVNPFNQNFVPIPFGPILNPPQHGPKFMPQTGFNRKTEYQAPPITIQTNSAEIAPLLIKVSKPMKVMNQHIIVSTQNPFDKQRDQKLHEDNKQRLSLKYAKPLLVDSERNHNVANPSYADLTNNLRIAENVKQEFRQSYKDKIQKIKERTEHNMDKVNETKRPLDSDRSIGISGLLHPNRHVNPSLGSNHHSGRIVNLNHHDSLNRNLASNLHVNFDPPIEINHHEKINEPALINRHENLNRPEDLSYRDREFLSRLIDSNHQDVKSQMVEPSPHIRRPIDLDRQSRSHQSDAYERFEHERSHPRYKVTKFHEKLEQVENRPENNYEGYSKVATENCCDTVAAREQMPLTSVKQRPRFDDSHFRNFLKSQQKMTDMLERILTAKSKARQLSGENR